MNVSIRWLLSLMLVLVTTLAQAGTKHYYYTDAQGTVLAKADAQGNIVASYDYAPYGAQVLGTPPNGPTGYTGHVNDAESGLVYMQQRYYDPAVGRFLSVDPIGIMKKFSRYTYASNNPIANVDPDGMSDIPFGDCSKNPNCSYSFISGSNDGGGSSNTEGSGPRTGLGVKSVFKNYRIDSASNMTEAPIPPAMAIALKKILGSPTGRKIAREAVHDGNKIAIAQIPDGVSLRYQWDPNAAAILYTLDLAGFVAANDKYGELSGIGLDTVILHEMGHTPYAARAFGYPYKAGYWQNEFNAVNYVENPYRTYIEVPIRATYGGVPVPPPSL